MGRFALQALGEVRLGCWRLGEPKMGGSEVARRQAECVKGKGARAWRQRRRSADLQAWGSTPGRGRVAR